MGDSLADRASHRQSPLSVIVRIFVTVNSGRIFVTVNYGRGFVIANSRSYVRIVISLCRDREAGSLAPARDGEPHGKLRRSEREWTCLRENRSC